MSKRTPSSTSNTQNQSQSQKHKPKAWASKHDAFVTFHAGNGEDAASIAILIEVEYPELGTVSETWVKSRM